MREIPQQADTPENRPSPTDIGEKPRQEALALFNAHLDLVEVIASRIVREVGTTLSHDDLVAAGREGLFRAAQRYDSAREVPFRVYANYRVRGAILDWIRMNTRLPRRAYERLMCLTAACLVNDGEALFVFNQRSATLSDAEAESYLDEHLASVVTAAAAAAEAAILTATFSTSSDQETPEEAYAEAELLAHIRRSITELDELEGKVVQLLYFEAMSLEDVARKLKMSKPWACRLHARAISRLTKRLRNLA